jgi:preprotein translocase subunit YajC
VKFLPLVIFAVLLGGMLFYVSRQRQRAAVQEASLRERLRVGSAVMTTSGLYGVIHALDEGGDTAELTIAPGVTVTWAFAALRDAQSLPDRYRGGVQAPPDDEV